MRHRIVLVLLWVVGALLPVLSACAPAPDAVIGEAVLQDIINNVQVSDPISGEFKRVSNGAAVTAGSQVKSGDNSLATMAFAGGAVLRLTSSTTFSLDGVVDNVARLKIENGRLRLNLFGFPFSIVTALGRVELSGFAELTYLSHSVDTVTDDVLTLRCFVGPCRFVENPLGLSLQLDSLEAVVIRDGGQAADHAPLSDLDLRQFIADNPGSVGIIATLTAVPTRTPLPVSDTPLPTATATAPSATPTRPGPTRTPTSTITRTRPPVTIFPTRSPTATLAPTDTALPPTNPPPPPPPTNPPPTNTPVPPDTPVPTVTEGPTKPA